MTDQFSRTRILVGADAVDKIKKAWVAIFGIGGVGSFAAEALARCGIGRFLLVDKDRVDITNINRQLIATHKTVGCLKTDIMRERILDINPEAEVETRPVFFTDENAGDFDLSGYSYVVDAIDTVSSKLILIERAKAAGVPVISSMGAGNKLDPKRFEVSDIYKTAVCPLARVMRHELRRRGIKELKVVYSKEPPLKPEETADMPEGKRQVPGSIAFVPSAAGLILAGEVIRDIAGLTE